MRPRTRSDYYIMTEEDGGAEYIELWCYRQAEAELEAQKLKIHNLEAALAAANGARPSSFPATSNTGVTRK